MSASKWKTLSWRIFYVGGISTFILMNSIPFVLGKRLRDTDQYKEAMQLLHNHPEAIEYLGEPIKEFRVKVSSREDYGSDDEKAWFAVPLKGPKSAGRLYCEFPMSENLSKDVKLSTVELEVDKLKGYKLLIKKPK